MRDSTPTNSEYGLHGLMAKILTFIKPKRIHILFFTISNLKSSRTYKCRRVMLSRQPVYSGIKNLIF